NQFLDDLRQADVLIHVIDIAGSTNDKGEPVEALSYDPAEDIKFLEKEIDMWYIGILKKGWEKFARQVQQEKSKVARALAKQLSGLKVSEVMVEGAIKKLNLDSENPVKWTEEDLMNLATHLRRITKPMIIAANKVDIPGADENYNKIKDQFPDYIIVPCSAESELALREAAKHNLIEYDPGDSDFKILMPDKLNEKQTKALEFIRENVLKKFNGTGVQQVLDESIFNLLKYFAVFPGGVNKLEDSDGNVLPDCFLMPENTTALDFAYKLHSDFGNNFIRAIDVKTKMTVGKEHKLKHRDVVEIISGK
ncbi:redox-regulated ATPase YchF, partial [Candidatus Woesearchaeota archaeon]|nr:redox-regulated ATPase YchF [Candidatus Woesearchaeota archaeon]